MSTCSTVDSGYFWGVCNSCLKCFSGLKVYIKFTKCSFFGGKKSMLFQKHFVFSLFIADYNGKFRQLMHNFY